MIKAVVFDLDDTLYLERDYVDSGFKAVSYYLAEEYKEDGFYLEANRLFLNGKRGAIFNDALDCLDFPYQNNFIKNLVDIYRSHNPEIKLDNESLQVLKYFSQNYKTALITDGYKIVQRNKIKALGISKYFDFMCVTDELGREYWKPSEKPYTTVQNTLCVQPTECVYIADNPLKDFVTPNRLGWKTVQLLSDTGEYSSLSVEIEYEAQYQIRTLAELSSLPLF